MERQHIFERTGVLLSGLFAVGCDRGDKTDVVPVKTTDGDMVISNIQRDEHNLPLSLAGCLFHYTAEGCCLQEK